MTMNARTNFKKWTAILADLAEMVLALVGGLAGIAIIVAVPVAAIYGFVAGFIYVVVKTLQATGVL